MEGEIIPEAVLSSGRKMAFIGMGAATSPLPPPDLLTASLVDGINIGYRHFDTAPIYGTEDPLGRAITDALRLGLIKTRDDVFITSKLWCTNADRDLVLPALKNTLEKLGLEYIDLYLIHWPVRLKQGESIKISKEDFIHFDMKRAWEAMEECCRLGLTKSIGVSNFSCQKLSQLLANATIPPAVNQVELNPGWQQRKMRYFCKENGIHVSAWSPLGAYGTPWGSPAVMDNPILKDIAKVKRKSVAQVSLRWLYQQGVSPVVKSFKKERMKENLEIFDWELGEDKLQKINQIPQCRGFSGEMCVSPNGPYKTLEELWDGEI